MESSHLNNVKSLFATQVIIEHNAVPACVVTAIRQFLLHISCTQHDTLNPPDEMFEDLLNDRASLQLCPELDIAREVFFRGFESLWRAYHTTPVPSMELTSCKYNIMRAGEMRHIHMHKKTDAYALIYLDDVTAGGEIVLHDPKFTDSPFSDKQIELLQPRAGTLLVAPAYIWHGVNPYFGTSPRVALVANCVVNDMS